MIKPAIETSTHNKTVAPQVLTREQLQSVFGGKARKGLNDAPLGGNSVRASAQNG